MPKYLSILIYGNSDAGKTVLASCSDDLDPKELKVVENACLLDAEGGTASLITRGAGIVVERFPTNPTELIGSKAELLAGLSHVLENKDRLKYVAIDSLDRFQQAELDRLVQINDKIDRPGIQQWGDILTVVQRLCRSIPTWGIHSIFTCHAKRDTDEQDRILKMMPLLRGSIQDEISSYFDVVAYVRKEEDDEGNPIRVLYINGGKDFFGRSRLGGALPDVIVNPTIPGIVETYENNRERIIESLKNHPRVEIIEERTM